MKTGLRPKGLSYHKQEDWTLTGRCIYKKPKAKRGIGILTTHDCTELVEQTRAEANDQVFDHYDFQRTIFFTSEHPRFAFTNSEAMVERALAREIAPALLSMRRLEHHHDTILETGKQNNASILLIPRGSLGYSALCGPDLPLDDIN